METFGRTDLSSTSTQVLNRLRAKEITLPGFLTECAFWAVRDGFEELAPHPLPTVPTTEAFNEYINLPFAQRERLDGTFFLNHPEVNGYYQQVNSVKWRNKFILDWLKDLKGYLPVDDEIYLRKIDNRILEFDAFFDENPIIVQKIKSVFQAKEYRRKSPMSIGEAIAETY